MKKTALKKILTGSLSVLFFLIQTHGVFASFTDVPSAYPQAKSINVLEMEKVIGGYSDGTFKPDKLITRGEFLKMVFNDIGYKAAPSLGATPFVDVPSGNWITPYVQKALQINAISATGAQPKFNPTNPINKVDALKIAFAIEGIPTPYYTDIDPQELFSDVSPSAWYAYLARAAKLNGIVSSKQPEMFWANHLLTRGDAAELIYEIEVLRQSTLDGSSPNQTSVISQNPSTSNLDDLSSQLVNNPKFNILLDVWDRANSEYYGKSKINQDELIYGAIKGLVDKLGDQYTVFEEPSDALGLQQYLAGQFEGVGIFLNFTNNQLVILKTVPGSPADKAGLQTGDVIQKINDQSVANLTINQAMDLIKGATGTTVTLSIERNNQTFNDTLTRTEITISSISGKMMNNLAYVSVSEFTQTTPDDFTKTLSDLSKQSPKGYILDLRSNPGGYLDSALAMLGHFVPKGTTVVSTKSSDGTTNAFQATGDDELKGKPLVVLVDQDTASAAEIMAGALQDLKLAKLVGVKTYGKGSVQEITNYTDNSLLKITIAHWLTPNGRDINGAGLTPDVNIELDQTQLLKGTDNQLNKAVDTLNSIINGQS